MKKTATESQPLRSNSEFLVSKLDGAIDRVSDIGVISYGAGSVIGLVAILLALVAITPSSIIDIVRVPLLIIVAVSLFAMLWLTRQLSKMRRVKLNLLRRWRLEMVHGQEHANELTPALLDSLDRLIDAVEDAERSILNDTSRTRLDSSFLEVISP